jgi:isochorismate synthase
VKRTDAAAPRASGHDRVASSAPDPSLARLRHEARRLVESALRDAPYAGAFALTLPAPAAPIERVLRALPTEEAWCFAPSSGMSTASLGAAVRVESSCESDSLARARAELGRLFAGLAHRVEDGALRITPRAMLGIAFEARGGASEPWRELGAGAFVLPRWTYWTRDGQAALTWALAPGERLEWEVCSRELDAIFDALAAPHRAPVHPKIIELAHSDAEDWAALVERIHVDLRRGHASKIVAARRSLLEADGPLDPVSVLERIGEAPDGATRYLVRRGSTAFVGCTPERLFVKRGLALETEALAGSIGASAVDGEARLTASEKDRDEHARVVEHLVTRLAPLSARVEAAPSPRIRRLPTVLHLRTPIEAELLPGVDALAVIDALHPTPAVGGTPVMVARRFIADHEPDRGWYAAPLGFVDARGDAEVFVGLRCVLLRGTRAYLWAGAGIVAASEAAPEWDETVLKMRPMLRALGVEDA